MIAKTNFDDQSQINLIVIQFLIECIRNLLVSKSIDSGKPNLFHDLDEDKYFEILELGIMLFSIKMQKMRDQQFLERIEEFDEMDSSNSLVEDFMDNSVSKAYIKIFCLKNFRDIRDAYNFDSVFSLGTKFQNLLLNEMENEIEENHKISFENLLVEIGFSNSISEIILQEFLDTIESNLRKWEYRAKKIKNSFHYNISNSKFDRYCYPAILAIGELNKCLKYNDNGLKL